MSNLIPYSDVRLMAVDIQKSGMFNLKTVEAASALMLLSQAEGLHPVQALRRFHILADGRISMRADAILAAFRSAGGRVKWLTPADDINIQTGLWTFEGVETKIGFTVKEALEAGYTTNPPKVGSGWHRDPAAMLRARSVSRAVRMLCPEVIVGLYTPEEMEDIPKDARPGNIEVQARRVQEAPRESAPPPDSESEPLALADDQPQDEGDEAKRLKHLRGKFNQELLTVKTPKEFAKARGDFERAHGKPFLKKMTGHKPGETFESLMTEHWRRVEFDNREGIWRASLEKCVAELLFRPLEEAILSKDIPNTDENFAILEKAGKRLRLPEYGWAPEWEAAQNGQKEVNS